VLTFSPSARASHFGALSIGHCQTADRPAGAKDTFGVPGVVQALQDPKIFKDTYDFGYDKPAVKDPQQKHVRDAIIALITHFYKLGVDFGKKEKLGHFISQIARLGHTTGDSFSCSHTIRDAKTLKVLYYQDYGAQDGAKHAASGDKLTGKAPFARSTERPLTGFYKAMDHIGTAMRIAIRDVCSTRMKKPYQPVISKQATSPLEELQAYYRDVVFDFAAPFFADYPAKGCVTKSSALETKAEQRVCKFAESAKAVGGESKFLICPDAPIEAKTDMN